jgi:hypothetical protein
MITKSERRGLKGGTDYFAVCDMEGFAELAASVPAEQSERRGASRGGEGSWYGDKTYTQALDCVRNGDLAGVAASEQLLDKLEAEQFVSPVWRNRLDVVGGSPCVPAYLAGHPMAMRRRERVMSEQGPLTIIVAMTLSGAIEVEDMRKRGATLLALVRLLSTNRPVEIWTAVCLGSTGRGAHVLTKLDTAPLDLARAAHMLTDPCVTRGLGYASCNHIASGGYMGGWPHGNFEAYQRTARELYSNVIGTSSEVLYVGAAHVNDPTVKEPVKWLKETLAQYGGAALAE